MADWKGLGLEIRARRTMAGMSQDALGERLGYSGQWVGKLERGQGETWPAPAVFNGLSDILCVPVQHFLRAAGLRLPEDDLEDLRWLGSQLDDEGLDLLVEIGRGLLPRFRRRPGTAQYESSDSHPPALGVAAEGQGPGYR